MYELKTIDYLVRKHLVSAKFITVKALENNVTGGAFIFLVGKETIEYTWFEDRGNVVFQVKRTNEDVCK